MVTSTSGRPGLLRLTLATIGPNCLGENPLFCRPTLIPENKAPAACLLHLSGVRQCSVYQYYLQPASQPIISPHDMRWLFRFRKALLHSHQKEALLIFSNVCGGAGNIELCSSVCGRHAFSWVRIRWCVGCKWAVTTSKSVTETVVRNQESSSPNPWTAEVLFLSYMYRIIYTFTCLQQYFSFIYFLHLYELKHKTSSSSVDCFLK